MTHHNFHPLTAIIAAEYAHLCDAMDLLFRRGRPVPTAQLQWLAEAERRVRAACAAALAGGSRAEVVYATDALLDALSETTAVVATSAGGR